MLDVIMDNTKKRINRIIGQLKGIEKMIEVERGCSEILQQISAVKKAIDGLSKEIVISDICKIVPQDRTGEVKQMVERAINL
ncbi:MAG: metal-sensitive transcriptional regulator [Candidatus Microgenomates bacterium]